MSLQCYIYYTCTSTCTDTGYKFKFLLTYFNTILYLQVRRKTHGGIQQDKRRCSKLRYKRFCFENILLVILFIITFSVSILSSSLQYIAIPQTNLRLWLFISLHIFVWLIYIQVHVYTCQHLHLNLHFYRPYWSW